ncbi:LysR family transcriptional regulator [Halobacillus kuroshimensis]|uniref:LysR family transcriptional regulator n=1 Tax=Halobacillus kuroshimensis TaxID=302481 RepID=UPI00040BF8D1|nr:LysR family transcriptional regulator [Halobacillus kuroshimensis]
MHLQRLQSFIEIARYQSFTKAAQSLLISQPALSRQMKKLEEELGFPLFLTSRSGIELTAKSRALHEELAPLFTQISHIIEHYQTDGRIRFGSTPYISTYYMNDYMPSLNTIDIFVTAVRENSRELLPLLKNHVIDAAIVEGPAEWEELYASFLFRDHFVAAVSNDSSLADLETVSLEDCLKEHQILSAENQQFTSRFQSLAEEMGYSYESTAVHEHAHSGFVSQGMGIAYFPELMAKHMEYRGITFLPIEGRPLFRDMYLAAASPSAFQRLRHVFGTGSV